MNKSEIKVKIDSEETKALAVEILQKYNQPFLKAKDAMDFWEGCNDLVCHDSQWFVITDLYNRETITLNQLEELLKNEPEKSQVTESAVFNADNVCFHRTQDRVRTHRGFYCGSCGKRF